MTDSGGLTCPSVQPAMEGAYAFGVVRINSGARRVTWIEKPVAVTPELLAMTGSVAPTQVMRFAGPCQEDACSHFDGRDCRLATRIVEMLDPVVTALPPCAIRVSCRWFRQEGAQACRRCPQIVTETLNPSQLLQRAATPGPKSKPPRPA